MTSHRQSAATNVALLMNDYKWAFFARRYCETLFGGVRLFSENDICWTARLFQILIWLLSPAIVLTVALCNGFVVSFSSISPLSDLDSLFAPFVSGCASLLVFIILQIIFAFGRNASKDDILPSSAQAMMNMLSDEEPDMDALWSSSAFSHLFPRRKWFQYVVLGILYAGVSGCGCHLLSVAVSEGWWWFVATGFLTLAVCMYSALGRCPVELSVLRADDQLGFNLFSRMSYAVCVAVFGSYFEAQLAFTILPVLFALGLLPSVDVFFLWALEQSLVHILGGSYSSSDFLLIGHFVLSSLAVVVLIVVWDVLTSASSLMLCVFFACVLSSQLLTRMLFAFSHVSRRIRSQLEAETVDDAPQNQPATLSTSSSVFTFASFVYIIVSLSGVIAFEFVSLDSAGSLSFVFGVVCLVFCLVSEVVLPHFLYSTSCFAFVSHPFLSMSGSFRFFRFAIILLSHVVCVGFVFSTVDFGSKHWISVILIARALRVPFQSTRLSRLEVSLTFILTAFVGVFDSERIEYILFFSGLCIARVLELKDKAFYAWLHAWTVVSEKKLRFKRFGVVFLFQLLLFPLVLFMVLLSVVLSTPLLPIFGAAVFLVSSPRTRRQFPGSRQKASHSADAMYYSSLAPALMSTMRHFGEMYAGQVFLLRQEANIVLMEVLEVGLGYNVVCLKGLEFQTTSCHAVEATEMDGLLEETQTVPNLLGGGDKRSFKKNHKWFHMAKPLGLVRTQGYSTSSAKVDIVLQNPEFSDSIFPETFSFVLSHLLSVRIGSSQANKMLEKQPVSLEDILEDRHHISDEVRNVLDKLSDQSPPSAHVVSNPPKVSSVPVHPAAASDPADDDLEDILSWVIQKKAAPVPAVSSVPAVKKSVSTKLTTGELLFELCLRSVDLKRAVTPYQLHRLWCGELPYSSCREWLECHSVLKACVISAVRFSIKIAMDKYLMIGPTDSEETIETISQFEQSWFFGTPDDAGWSAAISSQVPNLFALTSPADSVLCVHQPLVFSVLSMNEEAVRSIWAALAMELLYATNDDDERYSIQAHKRILRNILVQAADPPLGYPVFSSGAQIVMT